LEKERHGSKRLLRSFSRRPGNQEEIWKAGRQEEKGQLNKESAFAFFR
jgi:hypothetical protein